jgi:hypothetical protein
MYWQPGVRTFVDENMRKVRWLIGQAHAIQIHHPFFTFFFSYVVD